MSDPHKSPDDELAGTEQPFVQHLVELRDRLIKAVIAVGIAAAALSLYPGPAALYDLLASPLVATLPKGSSTGSSRSSTGDSSTVTMSRPWARKPVPSRRWVRWDLAR